MQKLAPLKLAHFRGHNPITLTSTKIEKARLSRQLLSITAKNVSDDKKVSGFDFKCKLFNAQGDLVTSRLGREKYYYAGVEDKNFPAGKSRKFSFSVNQFVYGAVAEVRECAVTEVTLADGTKLGAE